MEPETAAVVPVKKKGVHEVLLLIAGIIIIVGVYIAYARSHSVWPFSNMQYISSYNAAKQQYLAGNYPDAVSRFTELARTAPNKELEGKIKILLASAYLQRNQPGDEAQAMKLYKDVAGDYRVPAYVRALTLNSIAKIVSSHDLSFYKLYFPEDPYPSYIPLNGDDASKVREIYFKLLLLADTTDANSYSEYLIAGSYYAPKIGQMLAQGVLPSDPQLQDAARSAKQYIQKADKIDDSNIYLHNLLIESYLNRATGITSSEAVLDSMTLDQREDAYTKLFMYVATLPPTEQAQPDISSIVFRARFFYASFLMKFIGASRTSDVKQVLQPFSATTTPGVVPPSAYMQARADALAKTSPEFASYWGVQK